jgi:hypothetical protein
MKNINVCLEIFAMSLAAAMSAGASLTISGSQLNSGDVSYSTQGTPATAGYVGGNAQLYQDTLSTFPLAMVTVNLGSSGLNTSLGTLSSLIAAGTGGNMSFDLLSITGNGAANNGGVTDSAYWVVTLYNSGSSGDTTTYYALSDGGLGENGFDTGYSVKFFTGGTPFNQNNTAAWSSLSGTLTVASVGVAIGDWNQFSGTSFTADIDSITLAPVPEPSTMVWGGLLLLPIGASTLRILRRRQNQGLGMTA